MNNKSQDPNHTLIVDTIAQAIASIDNNVRRVYTPPLTRVRGKDPTATFHPYYEIFIQIHGATKFIFAAEEKLLEVNDIMIIPAHVSHAEQLQKDENGHFTQMVIMLYSDGLQFHLGVAGDDAIPGIGFVQYYNTKASSIIMESVIEYSKRYHKSDKNDYSMKGFQLTFFSELAKVISEESPEYDFKNPKIDSAKKIIKALISDHRLNVKLVAKQLDCAPDYLSNLFSKTTGDTLSSYITRERMESAKHYLEETLMNISEIAWACGYESPSYFSKIFKYHYQLTPKQYRKRNYQKDSSQTEISLGA